MVNKQQLSVKVILYILSVLLMSWYCTTLFSATKLNVSNEYKMHYIEKSLSDWPGDGGLDYSLNTKLMFGTDYKENIAKCRGTGWYKPENKGTWTSEQAKLYFNIIGEIKQDATLNLVLKQAMPGVHVDITINEKNIGSFEPTEDRKEYEFSVPKEILKDKFLCVAFNTQNAKSFSELGIHEDKKLLENYTEKDLLGIYVESINLK